MNQQLSLAVAAVVALQAPAAAQFLGVTYDGQFIQVDQATGAATLLFASSASLVQDIARTPWGRFWCIRRWGNLPPATMQVDLVLGTTTNAIFTAINEATSLDFAQDGSLYAVDSIGGGVRSRLYWIDMTGMSGVHLLGDIKIGNQFPSFHAIRFDPSGALLGWAAYYGLMRIDVATLQATDVDGLTGNTEQILGMDFGSDGFLYGGYQQYWRIDPATGATTLLNAAVGFGGFRGIARWSPIEPSVYCTPKRTLTGCVPAINFAGSSSLSGPDDLTIHAEGVLSQKPGLLLWADGFQSTPFAGGTLCVSGTIRRVGAQVSPAAPACLSTYDFLFSHAYAASIGLQAGDSIYAQWWSRDPGFAGPENVGLTDAIRIPLQP